MKNEHLIVITDEKSFKTNALKHYWNPQALSIKDFEQDLRMFNSTAQSIDKYAINGCDKVPERLLLNKIIIIHNVFGRFTAFGLFYKTDPKHWRLLKTFLSFLKILPLDCQQQSIEDDHDIISILNSL